MVSSKGAGATIPGDRPAQVRLGPIPSGNTAGFAGKEHAKKALTRDIERQAEPPGEA
jgi:hypothetical protein